MNSQLRDRILRKLDALSDERGYQLLDFADFLESRYSQQKPAEGNAFTRFSETIEGQLRAARVSASAVAETMGLLNRAAEVMGGAVAAGKSVAAEIVTAAQGASVRDGSRSSGANTAPSGTTTQSKS